MKNIQIGTLAWFDAETLNEVTHRVTTMRVDIYDSQVHLTIEKGAKVESIDLSLQEAKHIGLINFDALKPFCK